MGWRDRVDKSFANIGDIANRGQKMKKPEKERKECPKVFFKGPSHNSHYSQKPKDRSEVDRKPGSEIPAPEPPGQGTEYDRLWNEAWLLADFIDDPTAATIEARRARLPELERMRERMAAIEKARAPPAGPEPEPSPAETWHTWEAIDTTTRDTSPENCPAMCRRSGKCYSKAYFEAKPGRAAECNPADCKYISNERGNDERKTT